MPYATRNISRFAVAAAFLGLSLPAWCQGAGSLPACTPGSYPFAYASIGSIAMAAGAPFVASVEWTFEHKLADGNVIRASEWTTMARDSAGRTRYERAQGCYLGDDGKPHKRIDVSVVDPVSRITMFWTSGDAGFPGSSDLHVTHWPPPAAATPAPTKQDEPEPGVPSRQQNIGSRRVELGTSVIAGISASGWRNVQSIPDGAEGNSGPIESMRERWSSDELRVTLKSVFEDPRQGRCIFEVRSIDRSEPDPSLFAAPAGYRIAGEP